MSIDEASSPRGILIRLLGGITGKRRTKISWL